MMELDEFGEVFNIKGRGSDLAFLAALSMAAQLPRAAEGYLLELIAWASFADREVVHFPGDPLPKEEP